MIRLYPKLNPLIERGGGGGGGGEREREVCLSVAGKFQWQNTVFNSGRNGILLGEGWVGNKGFAISHLAL